MNRGAQILQGHAGFYYRQYFRGLTLKGTLLSGCPSHSRPRSRHKVEVPGSMAFNLSCSWKYCRGQSNVMAHISARAIASYVSKDLLVIISQVGLVYIYTHEYRHICIYTHIYMYIHFVKQWVGGQFWAIGLAPMLQHSMPLCFKEASCLGTYSRTQKF